MYGSKDVNSHSSGYQGIHMKLITSGTPLVVNTKYFIISGYMQAFTYQPILNISVLPKVGGIYLPLAIIQTIEFQIDKAVDQEVGIENYIHIY